jgi:hypothetical protein
LIIRPQYRPPHRRAKRREHRRACIHRGGP